MEVEIQKLKDLLDMGFIQQFDYALRLAEIEAKYGQKVPDSIPQRPAPAAAQPIDSFSSPSPSLSSASDPSIVQSSFIHSAPSPDLSAPAPSISFSVPHEIEWDSSPSAKSPTLSIENNGLTVVNKGNSGGSLNIIRAKKAFLTGKHSFKIRIDSNVEGGLIAIGLSRYDVNKNMYVGGGGNGWAYFSTGQKAFSNALLKYETKGYGAGDVITVELNQDDGGLLKFYRNGEDLGQGFRGVTGAVYPAVTVPGPDKGPLSKTFASITLLDQ